MPELTAERLRELLHYDPETGVFTRKLMRSKNGDDVANKKFCGKPAGTIGKWGSTVGYVFISVDGVKYCAHRLALLYVDGEWPQQSVDHRNCNRGDNRYANLRDVPHSTNIQNVRRASKRSTSGLLGVSWFKPLKRWRATIAVAGRSRHLGYFRDAEEAHTAYITAKRRLHPGCTI